MIPRTLLLTQRLRLWMMRLSSLARKSQINWVFVLQPLFVFYDQNQSNSLNRRTVDVLRLDPYVESGEWEVFFKNSDEYFINDLKNEKSILCKVNQGPVDQGFGFPVFELKPSNESYKKGDVFKFHVFRDLQSKSSSQK